MNGRLIVFALLTLSLLHVRLFAQVPLGNPLSGLETLKNFDAQRASSSDPNWLSGNADARPIASGSTLTPSSWPT